MNRRRLLASGVGVSTLGLSGCFDRFWTEYELVGFEVFNTTATERHAEVGFTHGDEVVQSWEFVLPPPPVEQLESRRFRPGDHTELVEVSDSSTSEKEIHVEELFSGTTREFDFTEQRDIDGCVLANIVFREGQIDVTGYEWECEL